ncbi:MAG: hypothetical protein WCX65_07445 [bacterium]
MKCPISRRFKRCALGVGVILLLLGLFAIVQFHIKETNADLESKLCKNISSVYACSQAIEKFQLKRFGKLVKRKNKRLYLNIDSNKQVVIQDKILNKLQDNENDTLYSFRSFDKDINVYEVEIQYYESGALLLVNKANGEQIEVIGHIKRSPDKKRIISYNMDLQAGFDPNGFQILKLSNNHFIKELDVELKNWGPSNAKWINKTEVEIEKTIFSSHGETIIGTARYILKNNKWVQK